MVLEASVAAYRVDHEMRMNVISVRMRCHYNFKTGDLLRKLQSNLMSHLRGDGIIWTEGLHHMVVHPPLGIVVQTLGIHKFLQCALRYTVDAGDQRSTLVVYLSILTAVMDDRIETANRLGALAFYEMDDSHYFHRLVFKMSEIKSPTCP